MSHSSKARCQGRTPSSFQPFPILPQVIHCLHFLLKAIWFASAERQSHEMEDLLWQIHWVVLTYSLEQPNMRLFICVSHKNFYSQMTWRLQILGVWEAMCFCCNIQVGMASQCVGMRQMGSCSRCSWGALFFLEHATRSQGNVGW